MRGTTHVDAVTRSPARWLADRRRSETSSRAQRSPTRSLDTFSERAFEQHTRCRALSPPGNAITATRSRIRSGCAGRHGTTGRVPHRRATAVPDRAGHNDVGHLPQRAARSEGPQVPLSLLHNVRRSHHRSRTDRRVWSAQGSGCPRPDRSATRRSDRPKRSIIRAPKTGNAAPGGGDVEVSFPPGNGTSRCAR